AAFLVIFLPTFILYRAKVNATFEEILLRSTASMSLQLIILKAVFDGVINDGLPFKRTQKGGEAKQSANPIKDESILAVLLSLAFFA
ncbi:glycosyl transferase, partial [Aliarcobacter butzleri]